MPHELELKLFFNDVRTAWDLAAHGQVADGYRILDAGLCIAEAVPRQPWSCDLSYRYRMALVVYADVHGLAREVPEELFCELLAPTGVAQLTHRLLRSDRSLNTGDHLPCAALEAAFQHRWEALSRPLAGLVGQQGLSSMLLRALGRARKEHPWLTAVELNDRGSLYGLGEALREQRDAAREAGCATLLTQMVAPLLALIGPELTRNLVSEAWPDAPMAADDFGSAA